MEGNNSYLSISSYNCEHADDVRLPFFIELFNVSDFVLVQEHGLFKSKLSWFNSIKTNTSDVGIHGVSAMDETKPLRGRPFGGVAILWRKSLRGQVTPVHWDSSRMCAVIYTTADNISILVICVYMPCDDCRPDGNIIEYCHILNEISTLINSVNVDSICIGGDFNTDLSRNNYHSRSLYNFIMDNNLHCCTTNDISNIGYTYKSKINGRKTLIDHILISNNLSNKLIEYNSIDTINNPSDHEAINCKINFYISYVKQNDKQTNTSRSAWELATNIDIELYNELLDDYLMQIPLPIELINCQNFNCKLHHDEICTFHNNIINALVMACNNSIPSVMPKSNKSKVVIGWNEHVEPYFRTALFWHKIWVENDRPANGIIADIHQSTRSLYHKTRKDVIKN